MTGLGWLMVLFLIGFFSFLTIKILPIYMENHSVKGIIKALKADPLTAKMSSSAVRTSIMKRLLINGIRDMKREHIKIKKSGGQLDVSIEYEVRRPLFKNIAVIVSFKDSMKAVSN